MTRARSFAGAFELVHEYADLPDDVADVCVTLAVHAGIAAADVICCSRLGQHSRGDNHNEAVTMLRSADATAARHLDALLRLKTPAGYSHPAVTLDDLKRAHRAMTELLARAERA